MDYIKWGFESRLKLPKFDKKHQKDYIKRGFESRLKLGKNVTNNKCIISNGDLRVD